MTTFKDYQDTILQREVREFTIGGEKWRFPALLNKRFEVTDIINVGGFGALLKANDLYVFNRSVLIKTGFLPKKDLSVPNNMAIPDMVEDLNRRFGMERNLLLHGQMRHISGIPVLIDWFYEASPMIRGPHPSNNSGEVYHDDPRCWDKVAYLVLSYFDGEQLDRFCRSKPDQIRNNPTEYFKFLAYYLMNILGAFHKHEAFGSDTIQFIYQDLKPANILVSRTEKQYCLIDFGGMAAVSRNGQILNPGIYTDGFAPPEATATPFRPQEAVQPSWDVFTLGATLQQCMQLAGVQTPDLRNFLEKCMQRNPRDRFQTMGQARDSLG